VTITWASSEKSQLGMHARPVCVTTSGDIDPVEDHCSGGSTDTYRFGK